MGDQAKPSKLSELRNRFEWLDRLFRAAARYSSQYGDYYAAAITYFSVLALVPLLMIGFAAAGFVLAGDPALLGRLRVAITTAVPNPRFSEMLNSVVSESIDKAGAVGVIGLIVALYSGLGWMTNLREALTAQWTQDPSSQSFVKRTLSDLLCLLGLGAALAVSFAISALGGGAGRWLFALAGIEHTAAAVIGIRLLSIALSLLASWLVFLWIFAGLPREPVTVRSAVWGAVFAALGFEVLKQVGVLYMNSVTDSPAGAVFGPVLGLLVFVYLVSRFVLFVAAWTASARENQRTRPPVPPAPAVIRSVVREGVGPNSAGMLGLGLVLGWIVGRLRLLRRRR